MPSKPHVHRLIATDLTASYVYSASVPVGSMGYHTLIAVLDPDSNDEVLNIDWQISYNDMNTADASSEWVSVGTTSTTGGARTYTADTFKIAAAAAGTKVNGYWSVDNLNCYKMRVGVKSTFTGGGSNTGQAGIVIFSRGE